MISYKEESEAKIKSTEKGRKKETLRIIIAFFFNLSILYCFSQVTQPKSPAKEVGDRSGEGIAYGNLGIANDSLGDFKKVIDCHERHLKIANEVGDRTGVRKAYGYLGNAYFRLGDGPLSGYI